MSQSYKVLVNTGSLYLKIITNAVVTLISTRIALQALGVDSYGLYNLIAGVISLLAFFNGALMVSSQRFLSFAIGENNKRKLSEVFKISFIVHLLLALIVAISLKALQPFLFNGFLNIKPEMIEAAKRVFDIMILSSFVTILAIPYNAAINAREEMWFFSISEVIVALLKLGAAVYLLYATTDLLFIYTVLMLFAIAIGALIKYLWCIGRYIECRVKFRGRTDKTLFKEMFSFAGWNTLGSLAMVVRSQGIAVVLNLFFGTVVNAAYGVANQLNALVITFASTLTTVFTPMIVKARGEKDENKMLFVSIFSSKMSFMLSSMIAIPVLLFTPFILSLWLKEVPEYTINFCRIIVITFLIMQLYPGITRGLYAEGDIKWYQISISAILIMNIPIGYLLFVLKFPPVTILVTMAIAQFLTLVTTLYFAGKKINLMIKEFYINSVLKPIMIFLLVFLFGILCKGLSILDNNYIEFVVLSSITVVIYIFIYYKCVFNAKESRLMINLIDTIILKLKK
ncbi:MAG: oligosaccharide flippase family protein [Endomicrobium sp.]|jgi:O-antigen/teichoic acid export membrane protein|nr:oligosaccharide flippase family protein [Endomicrobium sp.]